MRTKLILFMAVGLLGFALAPYRCALAEDELEKCHKDCSCDSDCNETPSGSFQKCVGEYSQAAKNSAGQGIANTTTHCGKIYAGEDCKTGQGTRCGGYAWEAGECDSS